MIFILVPLVCGIAFLILLVIGLCDAASAGDEFQVPESVDWPEFDRFDGDPKVIGERVLSGCGGER